MICGRKWKVNASGVPVVSDESGVSAIALDKRCRAVWVSGDRGIDNNCKRMGVVDTFRRVRLDWLV